VVTASAAVLVAAVGLSTWWLSRNDTDHHGGVLTMVGTVAAEDGAPATDVTLHWTQEFSQLVAVTNDGLVGFRRAGGVDGAELVPDLATALPAITDNGLSYTFHLRKGVHYSTGAPVLAGDVRRGIERIVVHPDTTPPYYTQAIVGAQRCTGAAQAAQAIGAPRPNCDLRDGITADDQTGTITFHLTEPTPDFIYQLALPNASAVPQDTPLDLPPGATLPATGPYMIRSTTFQPSAGAHLRLELVRNPYFHVWAQAAQPEGYPNRIVLDTGYTDEEVVARLSDGRADIAWSQPRQADADKLRSSHGSQLLFTSPGLNTHYVFLNAAKPPFNNRDARRAVAYALDRGALTSDQNVLSGPVTCQLIPPGFVAYRPYCPFTRAGGDKVWNGPDAATAHELVRRSETLGAIVVVVVDNADPAPAAAGRRVVAMLDRLGYRASLQVVGIDGSYFNVTGRPGADWSAGISGWVPDYPAPSSFLVNLASCDPDLRPTNPYNVSQYCDPALDKQMAAATAQQLTHPQRANQMWARIDREVVDAAAIIPFGTNLRRDLIGPRVGNTLVHPMTGPLIAQMWVQ
jgi:peptide/nickel transport system substrate-binding protein